MCLHCPPYCPAVMVLNTMLVLAWKFSLLPWCECWCLPANAEGKQHFCWSCRGGAVRKRPPSQQWHLAWLRHVHLKSQQNCFTAVLRSNFPPFTSPFWFSDVLATAYLPGAVLVCLSNYLMTDTEVWAWAATPWGNGLQRNHKPVLHSLLFTEKGMVPPGMELQLVEAKGPASCLDRLWSRPCFRSGKQGGARASHISYAYSSHYRFLNIGRESFL